jgi:hypothetical protein
VARRAALVLAVLLTAFGLAVFVTGGFVSTAAGFRFSSRSPWPSAIGAAAALTLWFVAAYRHGRAVSDLVALDAWFTRRGRAIVIVIAIAAAALAVRYGTFSASGSDASGYLSQADMLWRGELSRPEPLATQATWFDGPATLAPLGWRAASDGHQVPTYPVGLPLLMAPVHALGGAVAACAIVPLLFAVAIAATGAVALRLAGAAAAILSAVWLATSPVAIYEALQPMSDVPVTAAWMACWWLCLSSTTRARAGAAGVACAAAVLIRPNLAPLAAVPALYLLFTNRGEPLPGRFRQVVVFAVPVALAGLLIGYLQQRWFGSAFRSGYGTAGEIYARSNFWPNVTLYTTWLLQTHGPWLFVAPVALLGAATRRLGRPATVALRWLLVFAALVCAAYLFYAVFEVWAYLRFLLPALAVAMIAVASLVFASIEDRPAMRASLVITLALTLGAVNLRAARDLDVFELAGRHARAPLAGRYLAMLLSPHAVVVSGEQSGALRYYTGRSVLRWDLATAESLSTAVDRLTAEGVDVWIALDEWEEEPFRQKLRGVFAGALDWPPALDAGTEPRTRAWRLRDRGPFMSGEAVHTDRLR